jgi:hypothetical protein
MTNWKACCRTGLLGLLSCTTNLTWTGPVNAQLVYTLDNSGSATVTHDDGTGSQVWEVDRIIFGRNATTLCCANLNILDSRVIPGLQSSPDLQLVVDSHSMPTELDGIALRRAKNVYRYLVDDRGIKGRTILLRIFDDKCRAKDGHVGRVELYLLPRDKEATEIKKDCALQ